MDSANNEKIIGYFIEEAKEHLETIEKGILDLSAAVEDEETINELFRAAHSIKGGAAMLNFTSIQKTSHRLEDAFKILRDEEINPDQTLESLFVKAYDIIQDLLQRLQGPLGLSEADGDEILEAAEPHFVELLNYIEQLVEGDLADAPALTSADVRANSPSLVRIPQDEIIMQVRQVLQQMLAVFKQEPTANNRQQLGTMCDKLVDIAPAESGWQELLKCCKLAIANPKHSYRLLAPVVIKEVKLAGDCLEVGKGSEITPSQGLEQLAHSKLPQVLVTVDPVMAAEIMNKIFNPDQLSKLVALLQQTA